MPALLLLHLSASAFLLLGWSAPIPSTTLAQDHSAPSAHFVEPSQGGIAVPFEFFRDHIYVTLTVNGVHGMAFLVDTGTSANVLNLHTSQALGLKPENVTRKKNMGLGDGKVSVAAAKNVDLEMGPVQIANILAVIDLSGLERVNGHRTDGILGFPLLKRYVVMLDFQNQVLTLFPIKHYRYRGAGEVQYLSHKDRFPAIPVTLCAGDKKQHDAIVEIDTGSDSTLLLYPEFARGAHLEQIFWKRPDPQLQNLQGYGIGGFFPLQYGLLTYMSMRNTEITPMPVFLMQTSAQAPTRKKVGGIVGTGVLAKYRKVIFDVTRGRIILERRVPAETLLVKPPVPRADSPQRFR